MASLGPPDGPMIPQLDEQLIFSALRARARRKLLVALAKGGPQIAAELGRATKTSRSGWISDELSSTTKHLQNLVEAGIVEKLKNPEDGRRSVYALPPWVKVTSDGDDTIIDLGSFAARLSADGN